MTAGINRSDIVDFFLVEASEHLQLLNDGLLSLEENSDDLNVVDEIFRSAHTIKGSAAMLGFHVVSKLAHKMEDILGNIRDQEIELSESLIDLLLQTVDTLNMLVESIPSGGAEEDSILLMFNDLYAEFLEEPKSAKEAEPVEAPIVPDGAGEPEEELTTREETQGEDDLLESYEALPEIELPALDGEMLPLESPPESDAEPLEGMSVPQQAETPSSATQPPKKVEGQSRGPRRKVSKQSMVSAGEKKVVRVEVEGLNLLMNLVGELVINRTRLDQRIAYVNKLSTELGFSQERLLKVVRDFKEKYEFGQSDDMNSSTADPGKNEQSASPSFSPSELLDGFFGLEFDKYDDFNILSRRLVEIGSDVSEIMSQLTEFFDQFEDESSQIRRITNDLQEEITNIRMVPVGQLFKRFHRTVRDAAKEESKLVSLNTSGENAKLDKTVINEIADPLMHLIRNSVSHGIESPDIRESRGKNREGKVSLNAYKEGDNIIIEITDDGNGINVNRVRESIAEKGLVRSMAEIENMPDDEAIRFIFEPGFSTKEAVSAVSGRGVGMDVVKTNIAKLDGKIDIKTEMGKGTKFSIKLPLTLIIYPALLVKCGGQEFAISLTSVEETARIPVHHIHNIGYQEVIKLRDQVLALRRLNTILRFHHNNGKPSDQKYISIVIVRSAEHTLALTVDELIGRETIVIKPLGDYLKKVEFFSGATISGEGKVRLILDIAKIIEQELVSRTPSAVTSTTLELVEESEGHVLNESEDQGQVTKKAPELILIDDSISIRKVLGMFLSNAGYQVDVAVDGVDAIEKITTKSYDLILTDLEMPRMHGYELIAEVRSEQNTATTPIIVLTSRAGDKHYSKAMELGANDYIVKPVDEETLLQSVKKLLTKQGVGIGT